MSVSSHDWALKRDSIRVESVIPEAAGWCLEGLESLPFKSYSTRRVGVLHYTWGNRALMGEPAPSVPANKQISDSHRFA